MKSDWKVSLYFCEHFIKVNQLRQATLEHLLQPEILLLTHFTIMCLDWRGFYKRRLDPLDKNAMKIIQDNSHLIHDAESRKILRKYLKSCAKKVMILLKIR